MGCISSANNYLMIQSEKSFSKYNKDNRSSKEPEDNNKRNINDSTRLIKYRIYLKKGEIEVDSNQINKLCGIIKGFLFRKKYYSFIKSKLVDYTSDLYFDFIISTKNYKSSKIINNKDQKIQKFINIKYDSFYKDDPCEKINQKLSQIKKYSNAIIFKYKEDNENNENHTLNNVLYCYKGSVDIYTNKKNGYGELISTQGYQKMGTFYNDEFNGWNVYVDPKGVIFVGLFINDALTGKGFCYNHENDYIYKGDFVNNKKEGFGEEKYDGYVYKGYFKDDKKNGNGEMVVKNNYKYIGNFKNNKFNGKGKYIWHNEKKEYNGNFVEGKIHGNGILTWGDNMYYKGGFNNGMKDGNGEFGYFHGNKFFFHFKMGLPYGKGYMEDKNKNTYEVIYNQGKITDIFHNEYLFSFQ